MSCLGDRDSNGLLGRSSTPWEWARGRVTIERSSREVLTFPNVVEGVESDAAYL